MHTSATIKVDAESKYACLNKEVVISEGKCKANNAVLQFYKVLLKSV